MVLPLCTAIRVPLAALLATTFIGGSPAAAQEAPAAGDQWQLSITPYVWATALKGDAGIGRIDADVDASFSDILDNLNGALMLEAELRKGRFGIISDTVFANLEDDAASADDRLKVDATANMLIQSLAGTYRMGIWQVPYFSSAGPLTVTVDPYAGVRYTYLETELKGKLDLPDLGVSVRRTTDADEHWVDPIVGLRTTWALGERWSLVLGGDVGGITSDQYSAEGFALAGYRFSLFGENNATLLAGYRALKQKYKDGDGPSEFEWDMTIHGPIVGLKIAF
jgi:hypothetical protein